MRVVFDTNTVVSALLFANGQLSWLRQHWRSGQVTPLVSKYTTAELIRVLCYPKFQLAKPDVDALLADILPFTEAVKTASRRNFPQCRDPDDQKFIDLALCGRADVLVSGDRDLLEMNTKIIIETPAEYKRKREKTRRP